MSVKDRIQKITQENDTFFSGYALLDSEVMLNGHYHYNVQLSHNSSLVPLIKVGAQDTKLVYPINLVPVTLQKRNGQFVILSQDSSSSAGVSNFGVANPLNSPAANGSASSGIDDETKKELYEWEKHVQRELLDSAQRLEFEIEQIMDPAGELRTEINDSITTLEDEIARAKASLQQQLNTVNDPAGPLRTEIAAAIEDAKLSITNPNSPINIELAGLDTRLTEAAAKIKAAQDAIIVVNDPAGPIRTEVADKIAAVKTQIEAQGSVLDQRFDDEIGTVKTNIHTINTVTVPGLDGKIATAKTDLTTLMGTKDTSLKNLIEATNSVLSGRITDKVNVSRTAIESTTGTLSQRITDKVAEAKTAIESSTGILAGIMVDKDNALKTTIESTTGNLAIMMKNKDDALKGVIESTTGSLAQLMKTKDDALKVTIEATGGTLTTRINDAKINLEGQLAPVKTKADQLYTDVYTTTSGIKDKLNSAVTEITSLGTNKASVGSVTTLSNTVDGQGGRITTTEGILSVNGVTGTSNIAGRVNTIESNITGVNGINAKITNLESTKTDNTRMEAEALRINALEAVTAPVYASLNNNPDFKNGLFGWSASINGTNQGIISGVTVTEGKFRTSNYATYYTADLLKIDPNRVYKLKLRIRSITDGPDALTKQGVYLGVVTYDANGAQIYGGSGSHRYAGAIGNKLLAENGWTTYEGIVTGEGSNHGQFRPGTTQVRLMFILNYIGGSSDIEIEYVAMEDITDIKSLSAKINNLEFASVTRENAIAQRASVLETEVGSGSTGLKGRISTVEISKANAADLTASNNRVSALETELDRAGTGIKARLGTVEQTATTTNSATATRLNNLESSVNTGPNKLDSLRAAITDEASARSTADTTTGTRLTGIESMIGNNDNSGVSLISKISTLESTKASKVDLTTEANRITSLETSVSTGVVAIAPPAFDSNWRTYISNTYSGPILPDGSLTGNQVIDKNTLSGQGFKYIGGIPHFHQKKYVPADNNKTYRITIRYKALNNTSDNKFALDVRAYGLDANLNGVTSTVYSIGIHYASAVDVWQTATFTIGKNSTKKFPANFVYTRFSFVGNYAYGGTVDTTTKLEGLYDYFLVEDITDISNSNSKIAELDTVVNTPTTGLVKKVSDIESTINTPTTGLSAKITNLASTKADVTALTAEATKISNLEVATSNKDNLLKNSGFVFDSRFWTSSSSLQVTRLNHLDAQVPVGAPSLNVLKIYGRDTANTPNFIDVTPGDTFYISAWCANTQNTTYNLNLMFHGIYLPGTTAGGSFITAVTRSATNDVGIWKRIEGTYTVPANVYKIQIFLQQDRPTNNTDSDNAWFISNPELRQTNSLRESKAKITSLETIVTTPSTGLVSKLDNLIVTVGNNNTTLTGQITGLTSSKADLTALNASNTRIQNMENDLNTGSVNIKARLSSVENTVTNGTTGLVTKVSQLEAKTQAAYMDLTGIGRFQKGLDGWVRNYHNVNDTTPVLPSTVVDGIFKTTSPGVWAAGPVVQVDTTKTYRVRAKIRALTDGTDITNQRVYVGVIVFDKNKAYTETAPEYSARKYCAAAGISVTADQGWRIFNGNITGTGPNSNQFRSDTVYARPVFLVNYITGNAQMEVEYCEFEEILPDLVSTNARIGTLEQVTTDVGIAQAQRLTTLESSVNTGNDSLTNLRSSLTQLASTKADATALTVEAGKIQTLQGQMTTLNGTGAGSVKDSISVELNKAGGTTSRLNTIESVNATRSVITDNYDFSKGLEGWTAAGHVGDLKNASTYNIGTTNIVTDPIEGPVLKATKYTTIIRKEYYMLLPNRTLNLKGRYRIKPTEAQAGFYFGLYILNSDLSHTTSNSWSPYYPITRNVTADTGWVDVDINISTNTLLSVGTGAKFYRPFMFLSHPYINGGSTIGETYVSYFSIADVTDLVETKAKISTLEYATTNPAGSTATAINSLRTEIKGTGTPTYATINALSSATVTTAGQLSTVDGRVSTIETNVNNGANSLANLRGSITSINNLKADKDELTVQANRITDLNARVGTDASNLVANPVADRGSEGWYGVSAIADSIAPTPMVFVTSARDSAWNTFIPVTPGDKFHLSMWCGTSSNHGVPIGIGFFTYGKDKIVNGYPLAATRPTSDATGSWKQIAGEIVIPQGVFFIKPWVQLNYFPNPPTVPTVGWLFTKVEVKNISQNKEIEGKITVLEDVVTSPTSGLATRLNTLETSVNTNLISLMDNSNFSAGMTGWYTNSPSAQNAYMQPISDVASINAGNLRITGTNVWFYGPLIAVDTTRTYRVRIRVRAATNGADTTGQRVYAGVVTYGADKNLITGGPGTHRYCAVGGAIVTEDLGWKVYEGTITGEGDLSSNQFRINTKFIRVMGLVNYDTGTAIMDISSLEIADVTDLVASNSKISALEYATSNPNGSVATRLDQLKAEIKGPGTSTYATINALSSVSVTTKGVAEAIRGVELDVNGRISGYKNVNNGTSSSFTVTADKFQIYSPSTGDTPVFAVGAVNGVNKLALRGDMIVDGAITTNKLSVGNGVNLIPNGDFTADLAYNALSTDPNTLWRFYGYGGAIYNIRSDWAPYGKRTLVIEDTTPTVPPTTDAPAFFSKPIPVTEGNYYSFSALLNTHRASNAKIMVYWTNDTDASGTARYFNGVVYPTLQGSIKGQQTTPVPIGTTTYFTHQATGKAPVGARFARLIVSKGRRDEGESSSYLFFTDVMFTESKSPITEVPQYSTGGLTVIDGGMIQTGTLSADRIAANSISTLKLATNAVTADKILAGSITTNHMNAGSINADRLTARTIKADKLESKSITANEIKADAITADLIAAGTITADKLAIGSGRNLITNSEFPGGSTLGWHFNVQTPSGSVPPTSYGYVGVEQSAIWAVYMEGGTGIHTYSNTSQNSTYIETYTARINVTPGLRYTASASISAHRCSHLIYIVWNNAAEEYVGESKSAVVVGNSESNNNKIPRIFTTGVAPAGATKAYIIVRGLNTGLENPYIFVSKPMLEQVAANQLTPSLYAPSSSTLIDAGKIVTGMIASNVIDAEMIRAKVITASKINAQDIIAPGTIEAGSIKSNNILARHILAGEIDATHIKANAISAEHIQAKAISSDKLAIGNGINMVFNPNFILGELGWKFGGEGYHEVTTRPDYTVAGSPALQIRPANGLVYTDGRFADSDGINITGDTYYMVSAYVSSHRISGQLTMMYFDKDQNLITSYGTPGPVPNTGGSTDSSQVRIFLNAKSPVNAAFLVLRLESVNRGTPESTLIDSHIWWSRIMVEQTDSLAMHPSTFSHSGTTKIDGGSIVTGFINADRIQAGSIKAGHIDVQTVRSEMFTESGKLLSTEISPGAIKSNLIEGEAIKAEHIKAGAITTDKLSIGSGRNLVPNSNFSGGFSDGWMFNDGSTALGVRTINGQPTNSYITTKTADPDYNFGTTILKIDFPTNTLVDAKVFVDSPKIPIIAGRHYMFQALTGAHRTTVRMEVLFLKASGETVLQYYSPPASTNTPLNNIALWTNHFKLLQAPATAVQAIIRIVHGVHTAAQPVMWVTNVMAEEATANTTQPSPYVQSGSTLIDGNMIKTGTLDANRIKANTLQVTEANISGKISASKLAIVNGSTGKIEGTLIDGKGIFTTGRVVSNTGFYLLKPGYTEGTAISGTSDPKVAFGVGADGNVFANDFVGNNVKLNGKTEANAYLVRREENVPLTNTEITSGKYNLISIINGYASVVSQNAAGSSAMGNFLTVRIPVAYTYKPQYLTGDITYRISYPANGFYLAKITAVERTYDSTIGVSTAVVAGSGAATIVNTPIRMEVTGFRNYVDISLNLEGVFGQSGYTYHSYEGTSVLKIMG